MGRSDRGKRFCIACDSTFATRWSDSTLAAERLSLPPSIGSALVSNDETAKSIRDLLHQAADAGAHLLHTSEGGWYHNFQPRKLREDEIMTWGTPSKHPRQIDGQAEP